MAPDTVGLITIRSPGKMTKANRKLVARWLRGIADEMNNHGNEYTLGRYRARFIATFKELRQ